MRAERRNERLQLSISPAFKAYLQERFENDDSSEAARRAGTLASYVVFLLEEAAGYDEKRFAEHQAKLEADRRAAKVLDFSMSKRTGVPQPVA